MASRLIPFVLLFAAAGCGDSGKSAGDASATDAATTTATDAATTATDAAGDAASATPACHSADDCQVSGAVCACDGTCVVPTGKACTEDRNCGVPNWCNPCTGHCEAQVDLCDACTDSRACVDEGACLAFASGGNYCGRACLTSVGCPQGFECKDVGTTEQQCVPKSGSCASLGLCDADADCPIGQICSEATKTCAPGCTEDGQCPGGDKVCVLGRCVAPCTGNDQCTSPAECKDGKCKIPGACEKPADCPDKAMYCDRTSGSCKPGCQVTDDCKDAAMVCKNGSCAPKGCQHNFECAFGKVCDKGTGACVAAPAGEPYCGTCDAQAETDPACPAPNTCLSVQNPDTQESMGDWCFVPCKDDAIDRCPSGYQCNPVQLEEGADPAMLCVHHCWEDPVP